MRMKRRTIVEPVYPSVGHRHSHVIVPEHVAASLAVTPQPPRARATLWIAWLTVIALVIVVVMAVSYGQAQMARIEEAKAAQMLAQPAIIQERADFATEIGQVLESMFYAITDRAMLIALMVVNIIILWRDSHAHRTQHQPYD